MSNRSISAVAQQQGLPAAIEHERAVLGAILTDSESLEFGTGVLTESDFSIIRHQQLFRRIHAMHAAGRHVDKVTVSQELLEGGNAESVGGLSAIAELPSDLIPTGGGILEGYCRKLQSVARRRVAIIEAQRIIDLALGTSDDEEIVCELQRAVEALSTREIQSSGLLKIDEVYARDFENWHDFNGTKSQPAVPIPFQEPLSGLRIGEFTILAARPGDGKSAVAAQITTHAAKHDFGVHFWSLEMRGGSILRRMVASEANMSHWKLSNGKANASEDRDAYNALGRLCELPIWFHDRHSGTGVDQIRNTLRKAVAKNEPPSLIVVDYLQLLNGTGGHTRNEEIGRISRGLKSLTLDFPVAILALSQLSRSSEQEGKREPRLSDLRDSGSLEQDADNVVFLHPGGQDDVNAKVREVRWVVRKQRAGHIGSVELLFHRDQLRFSEVKQ